MSNSSCNNVVSIVCRSEAIKATAYEMLSSNAYTTGHGTVGVDTTSIVNLSPKLTSIFTSTAVNVGPHMAAVYHPRAIVPPETMPAGCPSGTAPKELEVHDLVDPTPTIVSAYADVDVNGIELHNKSDDGQTLTTFWEVEECHHQVTDVQGRLWGSLNF